jgi:hypothetical protein
MPAFASAREHYPTKTMNLYVLAAQSLLIFPSTNTGFDAVRISSGLRKGRDGNSRYKLLQFAGQFNLTVARQFFVHAGSQIPLDRESIENAVSGGKGRSHTMKRLWVSLIAAGLLVMVAIAPAAADSHTLTIDLDEVDGSGVSGTATLTEEDGQTTVEIELDGTPEDGVHPVHIHAGTCDDLGDVVFPLEDVVDGVSESTVDATIDDILADDHAINVHLSADEMNVYVACGELVMTDDADDDAVVDDDDDAMVDDDDDAVTDDDDDATTDDDAAMTDDEETDDAEDLVPATGSINTGSISGGLMLALAAVATLGAGLFIRRGAMQS